MRISFGTESAGIPRERRPIRAKRTTWLSWAGESAGWRQHIFIASEREEVRTFWFWTITTILVDTRSVKNFEQGGGCCWAMASRNRSRALEATARLQKTCSRKW